MSLRPTDTTTGGALDRHLTGSPTVAVRARPAPSGLPLVGGGGELGVGGGGAAHGDRQEAGRVAEHANGGHDVDGHGATDR